MSCPRHTVHCIQVGPVVSTADPANVIDDLEKLDSFNDGNLYGSTGDWFSLTAEMNKFYRIDVDTGAAVLVGAIRKVMMTTRHWRA